MKWIYTSFPVLKLTQQERWYTQSAACKSDILTSILPKTIKPQPSALSIQHALIVFANSDVFT